MMSGYFLMLLAVVGLTSGGTAATDAYGRGDTRRCPGRLPDTYTIRVRNETCYQFVFKEKYWDDARDFCWKYGGKLLKLDDRPTIDFIRTILNSLAWRNNGVWTGLHDNHYEGHWQWVTTNKDVSESGTMSWWQPGHPGNVGSTVMDCARMVRGSGEWLWHETACNSFWWKYRFICEYEMTPLPTSAGSEGHPSSRPATAAPSFKTRTSTPSPRGQTSTPSPRGQTSAPVPTEAGVAQSDWVDKFPQVGSHKASEEGALNTAKVAEDEKSTAGIPTYAIIIAFGAGILFSSILILVIVLRRRRSKKQEPLYNIPNPLFDDNSSPEPLLQPMAMGPPPSSKGGLFVAPPPYEDQEGACGRGAGPASGAISQTAESEPPHGVMIPHRQTRDDRMCRKDVTPNIYEEGDMPVGVNPLTTADHGPASSGSSPIEETTPMLSDHPYSDITTPRRFVRSDVGTSQAPTPRPTPTDAAAQPTTVSAAPALPAFRQKSGPRPPTPSGGYVPMNGAQTTSYVPMASRGQLPEPPAAAATAATAAAAAAPPGAGAQGEGYEVPVSSGMTRQRQPHSSESLPRESLIYAEIPESDQDYDRPENIYATVDEVRSGCDR
nr:C-type lectin domain-containing receptor 1 [Arenicola marina]